MLALVVAVVAGARREWRGESGGEVSLLATRASLPAIGGVATDSVRAAIRTRLASAAPSSFKRDAWRHVRAIYRANGGGPLWLAARGLDRGRVSVLMSAVSRGGEDALRLDLLPLGDATRALTALHGTRRPSASQLADGDIMLTALYAAFGEGLLSGEVSPASVSQSWHIDPEEDHVDSVLARTLRSQRLGPAIAALRPQDASYAALRGELARYRKVAAESGWTPVPPGRSLTRGDSESVVRLTALRDRLREEGFMGKKRGTVASTTLRDVYDSTLAAAVARFQARHGIVVDSILGAETLASLNVPAEYRVGQIAANLERLRWLPRALGSRYILVNVPAFRLQAFDGGKEALEMKVIVGADYDGRATPVFSDSMQYVVFRPYWSVPDSIAEKEVWSKEEKSPGYLARNGYQVVNEDGEQRVRQKPGDENALGLVKFIFPNDFNIYLHDTPQDELFAKDVRAFSHGCIRLEHPAELAQFVLGWPADSVRQQMEHGRDDHRVNLPRKIPVYIVYLTAYMRDGQLYFGNDLYSRDEALVKALGVGTTPQVEVIRELKALRSVASR